MASLRNFEIGKPSGGDEIKPCRLSHRGDTTDRVAHVRTVDVTDEFREWFLFTGQGETIKRGGLFSREPSKQDAKLIAVANAALNSRGRRFYGGTR